MPTAFDAVGFVGFGVLEDFQDAAEHPSRELLRVSTRTGDLGSIGGLLRILDRFYRGRVKLDVSTNRRIVYDESQSAALVEGATYDQNGFPSTESVFETVVPKDTVAPVVSTTDPLAGATDVDRDTMVLVYFSKAMDPATVNESSLQLWDGATQIEGRVVLEGGTAAFIPTYRLVPSRTFTARVLVTVKDLAGNALVAPTSFSFTTGL